MEFLAPLWNYIIPFLIILTVLVFVHEMGHYTVARRNGVRVEVFSIGFGPEVFGWTGKSGTRWKFSAIPLGGYVKMFGDQDAASSPDHDRARGMTEQERSVSFYHKRVGQRAAIVFAGPAINYVFAVLVLGILFATGGQSYTPAVVGKVAPGGAAAQAGIQSGDRFLRVNGTSIDRFEEVRQITALRPEERLPVIVERDGKRIATVLVPTRRVFKDSRGNEQVIGDMGATRLISPVAGGVSAGSPAERAGLQKGDRFLSIGGQKVESFEDLRRLVSPNPGKPLQFTIERGTDRLKMTITPQPKEIKDRNGVARTIGLIGVRAPPPTRRVLGIFRAFGAAFEETYSLTVTTFTAIGQMIAGTRTTKELGGPLRIAEMSGDMAQLGLYFFVWFLGVLSLHLCLINLLPIPMLDGGHLLFYGIEAVRGKPLGERAQEYGFRIGLALVLTLMLFVTWNDLVHLKVVEFIKNLVT